MNRNVLKIVCNPYNHQVSYYFQEDRGGWSVLSSHSPLAMPEYTKLDNPSEEVLKKMLKKMDAVYNRKNRGLDIIFEGTNELFDRFCGVVKASGKDITCKLGTTRIVVTGRKNAGKTVLIEAMEEYSGYGFIKQKEGDYTRYDDDANHAQWYELRGIDSSDNTKEKALLTIADLSKRNMSALVYCIAGDRIDPMEGQLIDELVEEYPDLPITIVLTRCTEEQQDMIAKIDEMTKHKVKIIPTLAKGFQPRGSENIVPSFGLDKLAEHVFEGI